MSSPFMNVAKRELAYHKNQSYDGRRKSGMLRLTVHIWQPKSRGREDEKTDTFL